jgi:hypothetical protein
MVDIIVVPKNQTLTKVLKDALGHLGPYQPLMRVWYSDPGGKNTVRSPVSHTLAVIRV